MGAAEFDRYIADIKDTLRKWGREEDTDNIASYVLTLRGRDRIRFWRQAAYEEAERFVSLRFQWRPAGTYGRRREIALIVKSGRTPWENAQRLAQGLEEVRLAERRGSTMVLVQLLRSMFPEETQRQAPPPPPRDEPRSVPAWAKALHIAPDAPLEVAEAAYRTLSRIGAHPDIGGSHERMKALNLAIEEARKKLARAS